MKVAKCQKNIHTWHFSYDVPRANVELNIATFFSVCEVVLWCSVAALLLQKRIIFHPQKNTRLPYKYVTGLSDYKISAVKWPENVCNANKTLRNSL